MDSNAIPSTSLTLLGQLEDKNNNQAWSIFLDRYKPIIARWCRGRRLQDADVDEVTGCILEGLTSSIATFRREPGRRFRGWLKAVVENAVTSYWRKLHRQPGALGSGDSDVQKSLEQLETPADVESLAQELDDTMGSQLDLGREVVGRVRARVLLHTWQAFWLTAIEGQPAEEVAEKLGIEVGAVYVAKNRVRKMLRAEGMAIEDSEPAGP
jgi:RNA polymerase sigma-70 factor (ECF subfamily)